MDLSCKRQTQTRQPIRSVNDTIHDAAD